MHLVRGVLGIYAREVVVLVEVDLVWSRFYCCRGCSCCQLVAC